MIFVLSMLVVAFMSLPPKHRKRGRPIGTTPLVFKLWIFSYSVVSGGSTCRRWFPPPRPGETALGSLLNHQYRQPACVGLDDLAVPPGAGRTPPRVRHATENAGLGGWRKTQFAQGLAQQATQRAWRRTHCALGLALLRKAGWGLARDAARPGCDSREAAMSGEGRGTQSRRRLCCQVPARGQLRRNGKRPVWHRPLTGACETCGAANLVQKAAPQSGGEAAGRCLRSNRSGKRPRSVSAAPQESQSEGQGKPGCRDAVLFLSVTSLTMNDAPLG